MPFPLLAALVALSLLAVVISRRRPAARTAATQPPPDLDVAVSITQKVRVDGDDFLAVVGESHYQDALRRLLESAPDRRVAVTLAPEPENQFDPAAVAVLASGGDKVGYLARDLAGRWQHALLKLGPQPCLAQLHGGTSDKPHIGIVLQFGELRQALAAVPRPRTPSRSSRPALVTVPKVETAGLPHTTLWGDIQTLKRAQAHEDLERVLLYCVNDIEREAKERGWGVAPAAYRELAILYRKQKRVDDEVAVLRRFRDQPHAPGVMPPQLLERLRKLEAR